MQRTIHIAGDLLINYKNQPYSVKSNFYFPFNYPIAPPIITIYNPDVVNMTYNAYYTLMMENDKIMFKSNIFHKWDVKIIFKDAYNELIYTLSNNFPFFNRKPMNMPSFNNKS